MAFSASTRVKTSVASAIIVAEIAAGVVALAVVSSRSDASTRTDGSAKRTTATAGPSTSSTSSTSDTPTVGAPSSHGLDAAGAVRLVGWVSRSLPRSTPVLADPQVAADLRVAGFTAVRTPDAAAGARFVVSTPALRAAAASRAAVAQAISASVPVASAGRGATAVTVRQVATISTAQLADDARDRSSAEAELLLNPAIHASVQATRILQSGGLDLRSATVLALLASSGQVEIVRIVVDPAELAAGRPARIVDVRISSVTAMRAMLAAVASSYRLTSITTQSNGAQRLTWPVDVTSGGHE